MTLTTNVQNIIETFIASWHEREDYEGVLLTGSFASNTADEGSDIDLRILYTSDSDYSEYGDCLIDGKSVSFVGMSKDAYEKTFQQDLQTTSKFEIRRIAVGQVIDDKFGNFQQLQLHAKALLQNEKIEGFDEGTLLSEKLSLNRKLRVLAEIPVEDVFFNMAYFDLLKDIFEFYATFLQADVPAFMKKWSRFLTNADYRHANHFTAFPDEIFIKDFINTATAANLLNIGNLYQYVIHKSGGLLEENFMVRFYNNPPEAALFELS